MSHRRPAYSGEASAGSLCVLSTVECGCEGPLELEQPGSISSSSRHRWHSIGRLHTAHDLVVQGEPPPVKCSLGSAGLRKLKQLQLPDRNLCQRGPTGTSDPCAQDALRSSVTLQVTSAALFSPGHLESCWSACRDNHGMVVRSEKDLTGALFQTSQPSLCRTPAQW